MGYDMYVVVVANNTANYGLTSNVTKVLYSPFGVARPGSYKFTERLMILAAGLLLYLTIRLIGATIRFETVGWDNFESIERAQKTPIYTFWHNRSCLGIYFWRNRGITSIVSQSLDGEFLTHGIKRFGYRAIRGSSASGGSRALTEMIRLMRRGDPMAFAADGPRGPRYRSKPGPVFLAKKTANPIMPFVIEAKNYWTINSWDKMQIPRPFSKASVIIGEPIYVDALADENGIETALNELQHSLDELTKKGKEWRENS